MTAMGTERGRCLRNRRPKGAGISIQVRLIVAAMTQKGITFELRKNHRGFVVRPGHLVTEQQRLVLDGMFHEILDLLIEEEERPQ